MKDSRSVFASVASLALVATAIASCGGAVGEAIRPNDHTASGAMGKKGGACSGANQHSKPLVVDLDQDTRVDLEASMKKGVAVVAFDCNSLRVLNACKVADAKYEYAGVTRREQVIQMTSMDDVHVNLPISSAKLGAEMKSGRSIDLALVRVGMTATPLGQITKGELSGACDGATHFVQSATLGAFSMATGSVGKVGAVAEMFKVGAGASSESERKAMNKDGSLDDCRKSDPDAKAPPAECRAPLQIELVPILGQAPTESGKDKAKKDDKKTAEALTSPCPEGFSYADGLCTRGAAKKLCDPGDEEGCKAECDKGSPESCLNYANIMTGKKRNDIAIPAYKKACDGGAPDGCGSLALGMMPDDFDGPNVVAESRAALKVAEKGCQEGSGFACDVAGDLYTDKDFKILDVAAGMKSYERGCALGFGTACWSAAKNYFMAQLVTRDVPKGLELLNKACQAGNADECNTLGGIWEKGNAYGATDGLKVDLDKALVGHRRACLLDPDYCDAAARVAIRAGKNEDVVLFAQRGCDANDERSCLKLGNAYETGTGAPKDEARAKAAYTKACDRGEGQKEACDKIGVTMK
jgi:TPR repeat protein